VNQQKKTPQRYKYIYGPMVIYITSNGGKKYIQQEKIKREDAQKVGTQD